MHADLHIGRRSVIPSSPATTPEAGAFERQAETICFMLPIDEYFCCRACCFREVCLASDLLRGVSGSCQMVPLTQGGQPVG